MSTKTGKVFFIGAGPGDPGLITLKGIEALRISDVIIYDYLVNKEILNHARIESEKIYVGKRANCQTMNQDEINSLFVRHVKDGKVVARLKGGDPFVLGRGGEEAEFASDHNIVYEVIPGVTSAIAVPAYAGIPVTHRNISSSVTIVTGHRPSSKLNDTINWEGLAKNRGTLVFLMGVTNLKKIASNLLIHGKSADTPVALISWGCYERQRTLCTDLKNIVKRAEQENIKPPAVIVIGEVVRLSEKLGSKN